MKALRCVWKSSATCESPRRPFEGGLTEELLDRMDVLEDAPDILLCQGAPLLPHSPAVCC